MVRAKFYCHAIEDMSQQYNEPAKRIRLMAAYGNGEANKEWSKYTPCGNLDMIVTNPNAFDEFEVGKEYYLDFSVAE